MTYDDASSLLGMGTKIQLKRMRKMKMGKREDCWVLPIHMIHS